MVPVGLMKEDLKTAPLSHPGANVGCLLVHGFGDTAALMEPMALHLKRLGIASRCINLPGHNSSIKDFALISAEKLLGTLEKEYAKLKEEHDAVVVCGFSMGGLLALNLATLRDVEGLVTICAPVFPKGGVLGEKTLKVVSKVGSAMGASIPKFGITSLSDKSLAACLNGYKRYPARSILCLIELMERTRPILKRVTAPALIFQSYRDDVVWSDSGRHIYDSIGSNKKRLVMLENSRHKAPIDRDREILFEETGRFCLSHAVV